MPQEYSWEDRQRACDLYVMGGLTFPQVAQVTGISESQLKRWSAQEKEWAEKRGEADPKDWPELRKEFRLAQSSAPRQAVLLRAMLINNAISSKGEFKKVLAAAMWEKSQRSAGGDARPTEVPPPPVPEPPASETSPLPEIKSPQDAVAVLQELVNQKVRWVASNPGQLTSQAIKDMNQILALMEELKVKYQPAAGEAVEAPPDGEALQRLVAEVNKILGVK